MWARRNGAAAVVPSGPPSCNRITDDIWYARSRKCAGGVDVSIDEGTVGEEYNEAIIATMMV